MRVLRSCIDEQVTEKIVTKTCLGEHTFDCSPDEFCRLLCENLLGSCESLSARISGVTCVNTVSHLVSLESHLFCVYNDNVVSAVYVRSKTSLGLATEDKSNTGCETTKREIRRVNDNPLLVYCCFVKRYSFVALCVHCLDL